MTGKEKATVLIVEDEPEVLQMYRRFLEAEYEVRTALDGEEALEEADGSVDVILLDRRLPGISGDEVLEEVRDRELGCRVVMVTAIDPDTDLLDMEFDEYLVKPVTGDELRDAVDRMLARNSLEDRIRRMFAVASKLATLEMKLDLDQQQRSEQYQHLLDEFATLRDEVDVPASETEYYSEATLEKLQTLLEKTHADERR